MSHPNTWNELIFYSKPGCPLCDEGLVRAERVASRFGLSVVKIDILTDPELLRLHGERIPVTTLRGEVVCWGRVSEKRLLLEVGRLLRGVHHDDPARR